MRKIEIAETRQKHDVSFAMHDPATCFAGLFRTFLRGDRRKLKLDVRYSFGGEDLRFVCFEPLGAVDLRVLQGVVAMAGAYGEILGSDPRDEFLRGLRDLLAAVGNWKSRDVLVVKLSAGALLRAIGLTDGGDNFRVLTETLHRMSVVGITIESGTRITSGGQMIGFDFDSRDGRLGVVLNPRLTDAICGEHGWTLIELEESRTIRSDVGLILHQRLCAWISPGAMKSIELDTMAGYVWPEAVIGNAMRKRRQTIRVVLSEIKGVGWGIEEYARGKFDVSRPQSRRGIGRRHRSNGHVLVASGGRS